MRASHQCVTTVGRPHLYSSARTISLKRSFRFQHYPSKEHRNLPRKIPEIIARVVDGAFGLRTECTTHRAYRRAIMPVESTVFDPNRVTPHLERPRESLDPNKPVPHLVTLDLTWAVLDVQTNEVSTFAADRGHFKSVEGHRYIVFIRASDVHGVQTVGLDGSGMFKCATDPDRNGVYYEPSGLLPVSIQHQEFTNHSVLAPTLQALVVVMKPDIGAFDYFRLSGGFHHFNGMPQSMEFFAYSGVMTFTATASNRGGDVQTASLTTAP